ncbi:ABC transporter permease [Puia dinghuensis]|uniref:ABC transporter permease n=1 Tax=Puia dinghuensis TaxID=1792502 RepID=A0A8J2UJ40_9BACT|nr:ABC transporter permease [Puia dinghuensis]GGB24317.1 ABC transporter permease [Puia dinghuensis]
MIKNYFLTAWRNLVKTKGYSALNISGLAIGMAVALLIGLWVYDQYSYDRFLPDYQRLYRVRRNFNSNGETLNFTSTSLKLADVLRKQIPEIEYVAETDGNQHHVLLVNNHQFYLEGIQIGSDFLKMFPFPLVQGNAGTVLKETYSIVLTQSTATALFGKEDPIGKTVRIDNRDNLKVTGILKDVPHNSTFQFDYVIPFSYSAKVHNYYTNGGMNSFGNNGFSQYVKLRPGISYAQVAPKIKDIEKTETNSSNAMLSEVVLQPMTNWHLYDNYINGKETGGFLDYVRMFTFIGALVLLIACINFINLTTARSEKRAREVGVRKAIGSQRKDLIIQFLAESLLLTFFSFLFALVLVELALPSFNALTKSGMRIPFSSGIFWLILLSCVFLTALIAGSRPAFHLSSFNAVKALKGGKLTGRASTLPRRLLVVAQFSCSIALIISTIIIYQQIQHARNRPSGFDSNRLLMTWMNDELNHNYPALKNELLQRGIASAVTTASSPATDIYWHSDVAKWPGKNPGETIEMGTIIVGDDYFKTLGMTIVEGRDFHPVDSQSIIYNQAAIRQMRIKQPVGQTVFWDTTRQIVGVAGNALMLSPFAAVDPTQWVYSPNNSGNVMMYRLSPSISTVDAIAQLNKLFVKYNPSYPYKYTFADESYAAKFNLEVLVGKLAGIFATLAVFISCLGLFGLAAYTAEQRTKEIGIRKVLGASIPQVWMLLSKDFIVLVLISCLIASPVAFYFLHGWLLKYDYRISIGPGVFIMAAVMALVITVVTISFQAVKAAISNPVAALRSE